MSVVARVVIVWLLCIVSWFALLFVCADLRFRLLACLLVCMALLACFHPSLLHPLTPPLLYLSLPDITLPDLTLHYLTLPYIA